MVLNWPNAGPGKVSLYDLWVDGGPLAQPDSLADQDCLLGSAQPINADDALVVTGVGAPPPREEGVYKFRVYQPPTPNPNVTTGAP
jgi:hypothetical protein